jgi:hypothetical protein
MIYFILGSIAIALIALVLALYNMSALQSIHDSIFRNAIIDNEVKEILLNQTYQTAIAYLMLEKGFTEDQARVRVNNIVCKDDILKKMYPRYLILN